MKWRHVTIKRWKFSFAMTDPNHAETSRGWKTMWHSKLKNSSSHINVRVTSLYFWLGSRSWSSEKGIPVGTDPDWTLKPGHQEEAFNSQPFIERGKTNRVAAGSLVRHPKKTMWRQVRDVFSFELKTRHLEKRGAHSTLAQENSWNTSWVRHINL